MAEETKKSDEGVEFAKPAAHWDMYFLAMTIVMGGQYYRWNVALEDGFWATVTGVFVNGLGYVCLGLCLSEMSSTLPFSGGVYGFVRAFLGPYSGYIVSRYEIILNVCRVSNTCLMVGSFPTYAGMSSKEVEPAWWCLMFGFAMTMSLIGCSPYWYLNKCMGFLSLILMIVFILGSFASVDYSANVRNDIPYTGGRLMDALQYTSPMFLGIQYLPLISVKCAEPKKDIPAGLFQGIGTLFCCAIGVVFTVGTQYPGPESLIGEYLPMSYGFAKMFNISHTNAIWFSLPAIYANFYGHVWAYGRQFSQMAKSGLLPTQLTWMSPWTDTPYVASICGTLISFTLALCAYYNAFYESFEEDLTRISILCSYIVFILLFGSYLAFKEKYSSLAREFHSPLGIWGAVLGIAIFGMNFVGMLVFTCDENQMPLYILAVFTLFSTVIYFAVLQGSQKFSEEEKEQLFKAYLINANTKTRQIMKQRKAPTSSAVTNTNRKRNELTSHSGHNSTNVTTNSAATVRSKGPKVVHKQVAPDVEVIMTVYPSVKEEGDIANAEPVKMNSIEEETVEGVASGGGIRESLGQLSERLVVMMNGMSAKMTNAVSPMGLADDALEQAMMISTQQTIQMPGSNYPLHNIPPHNTA